MATITPALQSVRHDAGLFRIIQPKRVGGYELDYAMMYDLGAVVSRACASAIAAAIAAS